MRPDRRRIYVLAGILSLVAVLAAIILYRVLGTVFFAITVAYVLYPVARRLRARGFSLRVASALTTAGAFALVLSVIGPLAYAFYRRRGALGDLIARLPPRIEVTLGTMTYSIETQRAIDGLSNFLEGIAVDVASATTVLGLKLVLFVILLYALLLRPDAARRTIAGVVPAQYHDVMEALNDRVRETLYGIYVLQAATAAGTGLVALVVFLGLGYDAPFTLAVIAAILQFVPVIGPSVLVGGLALFDVVTDNPQRAVLVLVLGGVLVAALPDAVIRPRLASWAANLPTSLYFIGFVGGVLTVGAVGFVAGPLVVALMVEVANQLSEAEADGGW